MSVSVSGSKKEMPATPLAWWSDMAARFGAAAKTEQQVERLEKANAQSKSLAELGAMHMRKIMDEHGSLMRKNLEAWQKIWSGPAAAQAGKDFIEYTRDAGQRWVLFLDAMRTVGNHFVEQQADGTTPVLVYEYDMIMDGREQTPPVNYALVQIKPPEGVEVDPKLRPYIIIDPRAGHGPGIGGFKSDSQVGVALSHGHPVYFVIFFQKPEPGQTLADVTALEGRFVREVSIRHREAPRPVIVGNCQGGWAAMLLAASNPHVTGPVVVNGGPLSYWGGVRGTNPLRYLGGLSGGAMPALLASDLGNGIFDGAELVLNFEKMNPGNTWWSKYYNVYANVDTEVPRFTGFERWWSGFYLMNESEIRWIVENLFVGNKLERGTAVLGDHGPVDLRNIQAPIIVFASHGDDITPPQQALNWISELYTDEREIEARGQRIIYMIHPDIGHLGIFVSAKIALKEHEGIVGTLEAVEALAPGLYEMKIQQKIGEGADAQFVVGFEERTMADLHSLDDGAEETPFAVVDRVSRAGVDAYEMFARPIVKAMVTPASAEARRKMHPLRIRRYLTSDLNPLMRPIETLAPAVKAARTPVSKDNPFVQTEKLFAGMIEQWMNFGRDIKAMQDELTFFSIYQSPFMTRLAETRMSGEHARVGESLRELPQVQAALLNLKRGGYVEAVIRMLILIAKARGSVRQSRLERSHAILSSTEPFRSMGDDLRAHVIKEQNLILDYEPEGAILALPIMLPSQEDRARAVALVEHIAGDVAEMNDPTVRMLMRIHDILDLPPFQTAASPEAAPGSSQTMAASEPSQPEQAGPAETPAQEPVAASTGTTDQETSAEAPDPEAPKPARARPERAKIQRAAE